MYQIACVLLLCVSALQAANPYVDCGSEVGNYSSVIISDCSVNDKQCILKRNKNATIVIQFDVFKEITAVNTIVHGILGGVPVPFPIANPDACAFEGSGLKCPLKDGGGPFTYSTTLFVEKEYPKLALKVKWELKDQDSKDIVCLQIDAKIQ